MCGRWFRRGLWGTEACRRVCRRLRGVSTVGVAFACALLLGLVGAASDALAAVTWFPGIEAIPPADSQAFPDVNLVTVSCPVAGDCGAAGDHEVATAADCLLDAPQWVRG